MDFSESKGGRKMKVYKDIEVEMDTELLEKFDIEGILIPPSHAQQGMLVLSSKDDTFTLHIYKLQLKREFEYCIEKKLTSKTYKSLTGMNYFIKTFSHYNEGDFMNFIQQYDK